MRPGGQYATSTRISAAFLRGSGAPTQNVAERVLLYDFVTRDAELRTEHAAAINRYVIPPLRTRGSAAWIGGLASRRGSEGLNERLAHRRAQSVMRYVLNMSNTTPRMAATSFGESYSGATRDPNDPHYRAVLVVITNPPAWQPPPPRERPPMQLPVFNRFKIKMIAGAEGGEAVVAGAYAFAIDYDDQATGAPPTNRSFYFLPVMGFGVGAPLSGTTGDETWNRFTVQRFVTPHDFEGSVDLISAGVSLGGGLSNVSFSLNARNGIRVNIPSFRTPDSLGAGISWVSGEFRHH